MPGHYDQEGDGALTQKIKDFTRQIFKGRDQLASNSQKKLDKFGDKEIEKIKIVRKPIMKSINKVANLLTKGKFEKSMIENGYDDMFHLRLDIFLKGSVCITIEKNETVTISRGKCEKLNEDGIETRIVEIKKPITLKEAYDKMAKGYATKKNLYDYSSHKNNCQLFVDKFLSQNKDAFNYTAEDKKFVKQKVDWIFKEYKRLAKGAKVLTNIAQRLSLFMTGGAEEIVLQIANNPEYMDTLRRIQKLVNKKIKNNYVIYPLEIMGLLGKKLNDKLYEDYKQDTKKFYNVLSDLIEEVDDTGESRKLVAKYPKYSHNKKGWIKEKYRMKIGADLENAMKGEEGKEKKKRVKIRVVPDEGKEEKKRVKIRVVKDKEPVEDRIMTLMEDYVMKFNNKSLEDIVKKQDTFDGLQKKFEKVQEDQIEIFNELLDLRKEFYRIGGFVSAANWIKQKTDKEKKIINDYDKIAKNYKRNFKRIFLKRARELKAKEKEEGEQKGEGKKRRVIDHEKKTVTRIIPDDMKELTEGLERLTIFKPIKPDKDEVKKGKRKREEETKTNIIKPKPKKGGIDLSDLFGNFGQKGSGISLNDIIASNDFIY